jgi:hypothetical protein
MLNVIVPYSTQFYIILVFTLVIMAFKLFLIAYLWRRISQKEEGSRSGSFVFGVFVLLLSFFLSRIFYMIFDFQITQFDMELYAVGNNEWFWKCGQLLAGIGQAYIVYVLDKKVLNNKFKGWISYIMLIFLGILFVYPINTLDDFYLVSTIGIIPSLGIVIVAVVFLSIASKASGDLRKTALLFVFGMLLYSIGALAVNAAILSALEDSMGEWVDVVVYFIQMVVKIIGLGLFINVSTKLHL